jgi:hypothetical protein
MFEKVDVNQTAEYIELTASGYLDRVLQSHGWDSIVVGNAQGRHQL